MQVFENFFGISPDGGSGITECSYIIVALALASALFRRQIVTGLKHCILLVTRKRV